MSNTESTIIRTSVYPDGTCCSTGGYYDHRQQWQAWEFIGEYSDMEGRVNAMKENDYEFQHVVARHY